MKKLPLRQQIEHLEGTAQGENEGACSGSICDSGARASLLWRHCDEEQAALGYGERAAQGGGGNRVCCSWLWNGGTARWSGSAVARLWWWSGIGGAVVRRHSGGSVEEWRCRGVGELGSVWVQEEMEKKTDQRGPRKE